MTLIKSEIVDNINSTHELERLYRQDPDKFRELFPEIYEQHNESVLLSYWNERLFFQEKLPETQSQNTNKPSDIFLIILFSLIGGTIAKIPEFFKTLNEIFWYEHNISFSILPFIALYFLVKRMPSIRQTISIIGIFLISALYINLLPDIKSDTLFLAYISLPCFLWTIIGFVFTLPALKDKLKQIDFLRFNGEMLIYTAIILIAGMILTGITFALFSIIEFYKKDFIEGYIKWIVVYGVIASPIVATYIFDLRNQNNQRIAPLISKIFAPLFLITLTICLIMIIIQLNSQTNIFNNHELLLSFNVMLIVVLAICIFTITERNSTKPVIYMDYVTVSLLVISLIVDFIALSSIIFRLSSLGFTPNRIAVFGTNIIIFTNAIGILIYYIRFLVKKSPFSEILTWIGGYLPGYTVWTAFLVFIYPFIFSFK